MHDAKKEKQGGIQRKHEIASADERAPGSVIDGDHLIALRSVGKRASRRPSMPQYPHVTPA